MVAIELKVRNIETEKVQVACFESERDAEQWLAARPSMIEVLGVVEPRPLDADVEQALQAAMRPLDAAEIRKKDEVYRASMAAIERQNELENRQAWRDAGAISEQVSAGDASRLMTLQWSKGEGLRHADPSDQRSIPAIAEEAVRAWIAERNEWLHPRRQHVAAATLEVWPSSVPEGHERIEPGGQFAASPGYPDE